MTAVDQVRDYPFEPFRGDLPDELLRMVQAESVSRVRLPDGRLVWLVVGHSDVCTVLSDARFSRMPAVQEGAECPRETERPRELNMDGPAHTLVRRLAGHAFTARRIEGYRPRVRHLVDELLDAMVAKGKPGDLVSALVAPLPVLVVCEVLGVPAQDRGRFFTWLADLNAVTAYGTDGFAQSKAELRAYLAQRLAVKRNAPGDDLLSIWAREQPAHGLTDDEVVELAMGVLLGGIEINSTTAGLRALFLHPEQLAALRADPERIGSAVEEILRYTAVSSMFRVQVAVEDVTLGGARIRAGDSIMAIPWAANRDPRQFPDPHVFTIDRSPNPHLTFGLGTHFCLGAALGRMQVEVSIGTLLRRFPAIAPAVPVEQLPWRHDRVNGGIAEFPVNW